jgi:hypothetical protein
VFFDLLTIRFLLRYMTRPLHFFGPAGLLGMITGGGILTVLFAKKVLFGTSIFVQHGPLLILGMMLSLFGVQLLAMGLVGELLMRTHFESRVEPMYRVERVTGASVPSDSLRDSPSSALAARRAGR